MKLFKCNYKTNRNEYIIIHNLLFLKAFAFYVHILSPSLDKINLHNNTELTPFCKNGTSERYISGFYFMPCRLQFRSGLWS